MNSREEVLDILREKFGPKESLKILEFIESMKNVATQKDIYELKLKIEEVRTNLRIEIEKNRTEIEKVRAEIEKVHADLRVEIKKVKAEIEKNRTEIEKVRADLIKWSFLFWITQITILAGILYKLFF